MADNKIIFSMQGVGKLIPPNNKQILKDIYLSFFYGAKIGIIGLNGSGKSTLLKIIAGKDQEYQGKIQFEKQYTVGMLDQEPVLDESKTVMEIVREGVQPVMDLLREFEDISNKFSEPMDADAMEKLTNRMGEVQEKIDAIDGWEIDSKLERALDALNCAEGDAPVKNLSGGERRRVALCRLLLQQPDILLLDEPTNHLDAESILWLEQFLKEYKGTVIAVTHDRYFLDNVAGWILELDRGEGIPWKGNYSSWLDQKQKRLATEEKIESKRQKTLQRELEWVRMGQKARQAKKHEAAAMMEKAINNPTAGVFDIHQYGRELMGEGKNAEALKVFQLNAKLHPNAWPVNVGLARGYSATAEYKTALKYAKLAEAEAPDPANKDNMKKAVEKLEKGQTMN